METFTYGLPGEKLIEFCLFVWNRLKKEVYKIIDFALV